MRNLIRKVALRLWPELESKTHLPLLAVVIQIPDPPGDGGTSTAERPRYAVDLRMLTPELAVDEAMPLLRDVPVALTGAANGRGFAALPQPGTIVEVAFAFGRQSLPFVRSVLPEKLSLPAIDGLAQCWQQSSAALQHVDAAGSWTRLSPGNIHDGAGGTISSAAGAAHVTTAPQLWFGSDSENFLALVSEFMATTATALALLAGHTHPEVAPSQQKDDITSQAQAVTAEKSRLDSITKPTKGNPVP